MTKLLFVIESGTDVRMIEGLSKRFHLNIIGRKLRDANVVNHTPARSVPSIMLASSRFRFAAQLFGLLVFRDHSSATVLVQGYSLAALACNMAAFVRRRRTFMFICSPTEEYYNCRRQSSIPFRTHEAVGLRVVSRLNAQLGQEYIVLSRYLEQVVRSHGTKATIHTIPMYAVDLETFSPRPNTRSATRAKLGLSSEFTKLIFFGSRIAPEKDALVTLKALRLLLDQGRDVKILNCSGSFRDFELLASERGLGGHTIARGPFHPAELADIYSAADIFVQASRAEGLGFAVLESFACGLPVVAANVGGLRETVIPGGTGWTYEVGNAVQLADALGEIIDNPAEARLRAGRGKQLVAKEYECDRVFDKFAELLESDSARCP